MAIQSYSFGRRAEERESVNLELILARCIYDRLALIGSAR
jgi:hypothetical protein